MPIWLLREWQAYYDIEPFGAWRDNWHFSVLATMYHNVHVKKQDAKTEQDFMYMDPRTRRQLGRKRSENRTLSLIDNLRAAAQSNG